MNAGGKTMKGQYFSFDAIVAAIMFILIFATIIAYWNSVRVSFDTQGGGDMMKTAVRISDQLMNPGYTSEDPLKQDENVVGFGMSWGDKRLDLGKIEDFQGVAGTGSVKGKFATNYEVYITMEIYSYGGDPKTLKFGNAPDDSTTTQIAHFTRDAPIIMDKKTGETAISRMDIYVYR
ncbi:MAG: hypothetical protein ACP5NX_03045 [Candidatus Bilamarchaeaceae archaeon]